MVHNMTQESDITSTLKFQLAFITPSLFVFLGGLFTILAFRLARYMYGFILEQTGRKKVKAKSF